MSEVNIAAQQEIEHRDPFVEHVEDIDPTETQEWLESLEYVLNSRGAERVNYLLSVLEQKARRAGVDRPAAMHTSYINTIPVDKQPPYPGNREIERRIKSIIRWNAMAMVVRANRQSDGLGGHISTFASAATLYEVGFNHFFRGRGESGYDGDQIYFQGHASPGMYSRAYVEGRLSEVNLTNFRRELQEQWDALVPQWTAVTENIAYYDLPNCVHNGAGAPNPPALKILKFLYPRLRKHRMKGVYVYGHPAWGHAALMNYLLAKLAWDPEADADLLFAEFCEKAYAEGAGELKQFYRLLDAETERYFVQNEEESYTLSNGRLKDVYAANFAELERLYRTAEAKITDAAAQARLSMLGLNLTVLHWNLRQFNFLDDPTASSFYLDDEPFLAFARDHAGSLALAPAGRRHKAGLPEARLAVTVPSSVAQAEPVQPFVLRGPQLLVVRPRGGQRAVMHFRTKRSYGTLLWYHVYSSTGEELSRGTLNSTKPAPLPDLDGPYFLVEIRAGSAFYTVQMEGAAWAAYGRVTDKGLHLIQQVTPLYFEVTRGVTSFEFWVAASPPGETAAATLFSPSGRAAAEFNCAELQVDQQRVTVRDGEAGVWKLVPRAAATGVLDDVWIKPGSELSGYFSFAPDQVLSVKPTAD